MNCDYYSLASAELQSVKSVRDHTSANIAYSEYESGQSIKPRAMNGGSRVAETTSPLITHNTLIFLRCSYVGSNGSYTLATYGYAAILFNFLQRKKNTLFKNCTSNLLICLSGGKMAKST